MTAVTARAGDALERARKGDRDAFVALVQRHDQGLRALAYRLLGDRERMDDALQEAYVRAFRAIGHFRGDSAVATWLYRIAYNVCLEELARSRRDGHTVALEAVTAPVDPSAGPEDSLALRTALAEALARLAPPDRAAVVLVDAHGFDYRSAGEVLGVPEGTVASRLNRARALLRRALAEPEEGGSAR